MNRALSYLSFVALTVVAGMVSAKQEGELLPDLSNPGSIEKPKWFKNSFLDFKDDVQEAAQGGKRVVLYFYQDGCPYCERLIRTNYSQRDIVNKTRDNFDVIAVNMWGDREVTWVDGAEMTEKSFAEMMKVMYTPTMLFLDEKGDVALRINGYYDPSRYGAVLDYVSGKLEKKETFREYFARVKPLPPSGELNKASFVSAPPHDLSRKPATAGKPTLVLFEQKHCPDCDEMHKDVFKRKETMEQLKRINVVQLDMWSKETVVTPEGKRVTADEWAKALEIKYAPSLVFFDANGKEVFRAEAYLKSFHVQSIIDYVASKAYVEFPSFQRYIDDRADRIRATGVTIDLMN